MLMSDVMDEALDSQKRNIGTRTGRAFDSWVALARASGIDKHGALLAWLKSEHGLGHGDANLIAMTARRPDPGPGEGDVLGTIYTGPKAGLRPFHERVVALAQGFGDDVTISPKQGYVSLRRSKQFATVGPASGGRLELGLNLKGVAPDGRLEPATGMCIHRIRLTSPDDFDPEVQGWLREAYERA
jgi:Domain of unknown function (DUF5655)/Domain of unknown function (DUF4287)